jgi:hypothetical protein
MSLEEKDSTDFQRFTSVQEDEMCNALFRRSIDVFAEPLDLIRMAM